VTLQVSFCPYGHAAQDLLSDVITEAKGDDPLRPVTVLVARGPVGLGIRRELAAGAGGVVNVSFMTVAALADTLAQGGLAERGLFPLTDAVLRAALGRALFTDAGRLLGASREHPSTVDALIRTYRELRGLDDAAKASLSLRSERANEVITVIEAARSQLGAWFDEVDLFEEAIRVVSTGEWRGGAATPLVLYLPERLSLQAIQMVRAVSTRVLCTAIIGITGDPAADAAGITLAGALTGDDVGVVMTVPEVQGDLVFSAPTADAEVLMVVRHAMAQCEAGTPLERIAIAHSGAPHYVTLLHNTLEQADIPFNGAGVVQLSGSVAGRLLSGVLRLADDNWRRDEVTQWLLTGPIVHDGSPIPAARWDSLSAEAGVAEGLDEWLQRLSAHADHLRMVARQSNCDDDDDSEGRRQALIADAASCVGLAEFLTALEATLRQPPNTWKSWTKWAVGLLRRLVGGSSAMEEWPAGEWAAAQEVEEAVAGLAHLDMLNEPFSAVAARSALDAELTAPSPQTTRFGRGIWVTPVSALAGHAFDALFIVGMNDGAFPLRPADDVLVPDRERMEADPTIPLRGSDDAGMRRAYLAALAGATLRVLSFPRGSQRDKRELRPSRWLLDALGTMVDPPERLYSGDIERLGPIDRFRVEPSFISVVGAASAPIDLADRDLRQLVVWTSDRHLLRRHPLVRSDAQLCAGLDLLEGRSRGFTRFNGNVGGANEWTGLGPTLWSATRLEMFAKCPRQYFFETLLGVAPRPEVDRLLSTDRREYGTLVHAILQAFGDTVIDVPFDDRSPLFSPEHLLSIAKEAIVKFEADGLTGPRAPWRSERTRLLRELRNFARLDAERRADTGAITIDVERKFGFEDDDAVVVATRVPVSFRGAIDRIDKMPDGSLRVTDYKTGRSREFADIAVDHFRGGTALQLPVYALAAGVNDEQPVHASYWCISEIGPSEPYGFEVDAAARQEFERVVETLTDTLQEGHFPGVPSDAGGRRDGQCGFCPFDAVCPTNRGRAWERAAGDDALAHFVDLADST
jgi:RecB family exonuclease